MRRDRILQDFKFVIYQAYMTNIPLKSEYGEIKGVSPKLVKQQRSSQLMDKLRENMKVNGINSILQNRH